MHPTLRKLLCLVGRHQWQAGGEVHTADSDGTRRAKWRYCPHCLLSELKMTRDDDGTTTPPPTR